MMTRGTFAGLLLLCFLSGNAAAQCPAGFLDAGELTASAPAGRYQEVSVTRDLLLPKGIRLDDSYRQKTIQAAGDGAASSMRAAQIPAGIHLIPGGRSGGGWWSIDNPKLEPATQPKFKIDLYVNSGIGGRGGSDVRVRVCVKPMQ